MLKKSTRFESNYSTVPVNTATLEKQCPIFQKNPWGVKKITKQMVLDALAAGKLKKEPFSTIKSHESWSTSDHVERIAYFLANPEHKIQVAIDVGVPSLGCNVSWIIVDGNHQFAAAILRGDETVQAQVSGSIEYANHVLGLQLT